MGTRVENPDISSKSAESAAGQALNDHQLLERALNNLRRGVSTNASISLFPDESKLVLDYIDSLSRKAPDAAHLTKTQRRLFTEALVP